MKNLLVALAIAGAVCVSVCEAQQCGTSSGTNQCNLNSRPRTAEPVAVPQAAPASLQRVATNAEWVAPVPAEQMLSTQTASLRSGQFDAQRYGDGRLQVQPVGLNLGLVNIGNGRGNRDADGLVTQSLAQLQAQQQQLNQLREEIINARARGEEVTFEDVQRIVAASRPQMTPDEMWGVIRSSPSFQRELLELMNAQAPQIVRWEIVPVE